MLERTPSSEVFLPLDVLASDPSSVRIQVVHPTMGTFAVKIDPGRALVVGRQGRDIDLELPWDPLVSRRHAKLWSEGDEIWLEDLGSKNGTWIGPRRLEERVRLPVGSRVILGRTQIVIPSRESLAEEGDPTKESMPPLSLASMPRSSTSEAVGTDDLPAASNRHGDSAKPRHLGPRRVQVRAADSRSFGELWDRELRRGGLYVESSSPPAIGSELSVEFRFRDAEIKVPGRVVTVVRAADASRVGLAPGFAVDLEGLTPKQRRTLEDFARNRPRTSAAPKPSRSTHAPVELPDILKRARSFLRETEQGAYYGALGIARTAETETVERAVEQLSALFRQGESSAPPPKAARLRSALSVLARVRRILAEPESRLAYDFQIGELRVEARKQAAREGSGPDKQALRRAYGRRFPDRSAQARRLAEAAFQARQILDIPQAVQLGQRALHLDPFFFELEESLGAWKEELRTRGRSGIRSPEP